MIWLFSTCNTDSWYSFYCFMSLNLFLCDCLNLIFGYFISNDLFIIAPPPFVGTLPAAPCHSIRRTSFKIFLIKFNELNGKIM